MNKIKKFFQQPWLSDYRTLAVLWGLLALFCIYKIVDETVLVYHFTDARKNYIYNIFGMEE